MCKECRAKAGVLERNLLKLEIITAYGGECACCACDIPEFLAIDHIDNTGAEHRRSMSSRSSTTLYRFLRKNGFPKANFQLLCFNCNFAKHTCGICPHQKSNKS